MKRIASVILALCLILSLSLPCFASEASPKDYYYVVTTENGQLTFSSLEEAENYFSEISLFSYDCSTDGSGRFHGSSYYTVSLKVYDSNGKYLFTSYINFCRWCNGRC